MTLCLGMERVDGLENILWNNSVVPASKAFKQHQRHVSGLSYHELIGSVDLAPAAEIHKLLTADTAKYYESTYLKIIPGQQ